MILYFVSGTSVRQPPTVSLFLFIFLTHISYFNSGGFRFPFSSLGNLYQVRFPVLGTGCMPAFGTSYKFTRVCNG